MKEKIFNSIRLVFTLILLFTTHLSVVSQVAEYNFNENVEDQVGGHHATIFGAPTFVDGEYISFTPEDYLSLPLEMSEAIDVSESWQINVRFKVEGDWRSTDAEEAQVIVSSKQYARGHGGFNIAAREWGGQLQLITTYGDGIVYDSYGCPTCGEGAGLSQGKLDWVIHIDSGIWYDVKIKFFFDGQRPYIQYEVNGTVSISYFDNKLDPEGFRQTINQQQVWVGADKENLYVTESPQFAQMDLQIDHLSFWSPIAPGDPEKVDAVLQALINDMNRPEEDEGLTDEQIDSLRIEFVANWGNQSYEPNQEVIWDYINTYAAHHEPIFNDWFGPEDPQSFTPMEAIQFMLEQWVFDNRYGSETVGEMAGLTFEDHELFPGKVSPHAPRLEEATFVINGDYNTDPGFRLNGQDVVTRPIGYYVSPGELVTITIPEEAVDQGLGLIVGAHGGNLSYTWTRFRRFPRIQTVYELTSETITVANPFGGGIYIRVPDGTNLGPLEFQVKGAIKAPYYSIVEGFSHSLEEFKAELANQYVPFADVESRNLMATVTTGMATASADIDSAFSIWDQSLDVVNIALGRPLERFRTEYYLIDRQNNYSGTALPAAYGMSDERLDKPYSVTNQMPLMVEHGRAWYNTPHDDWHNTILHELGHLHNMPTLPNDVETNVHILAAAVYSMVMGESIDSAMVYSTQQRLNLDQSAMDWMLIDNFYLGNRMGYRVQEGDYNFYEQAYQARGHAKHVDFANLFGWEALGSTMTPFYDYRREVDPLWDAYSLQDDQYTDTASHVMGFNVAPHFEFWGIIPSNELVERLSDLPTSEAIKDRLIHFRSIVPANNDAFQEWHRIMTSKLEGHHHERYDAWKTTYDEAHAQRIIDRIDEILNKYYDIDELDYNFDPVITGTSDALYVYQNSSLTLELSHFQVEDTDNSYPDDFTLTVSEGENYSLSGNTITPDTDFLGELIVSVTVNDGLEDSAPYEATIEVVVENVRPVITGFATELSMSEDVSRTFELADFAVEDSDHTYPDDFTLQLRPGEHYSLSGHTIIPELNFFGNIEVPVIVNDGIQDSEVFMANITVEAVNDAPRIQGPERLIYTDEDIPITFDFADFIVDDPDNDPGDYGIEFLEGENYSVSNRTITPAQDFHGRLMVNTVARDDDDYGDIYQLLVEVYAVNDQPVITGQASALVTEVDQPITLELTDFVVVDPDNDFPEDFTLTVLGGENFTVSATTVTPDPSFTGELTVTVIVNDGELDSGQFTAAIHVVEPNDNPIITGQRDLSTNEDTAIIIELTDLTVEDNDHTYPDDFTLRLFEGEHYTLQAGGGTTSIIPDLNFFGELRVPVTVSDGIEESEQFILIIEVIAVNDEPAIIGHRSELVATEDTPFTLSLTDFEVEDPDNNFPDDFTITIQNGNNYTADGLTITAYQDFDGTLSVAVTVNDGTDSSEPYTIEVPVTPVNDAPVITGLVEPLTTEVDMSLDLSLEDFIIDDPDNDFPKDFTLSIQEGENYTLSGLTVIPASGFIGALSVPVTVNDGALDSEPFLTTVEVAEVLGIDNGFVKRHFSVTPNPTTDQLSIVKDQGVLYYHFNLLSLKGDLVYSGKSVTKEIETVDIRGLSNGLYILQITSPEGVGTFKVMKR